MNKKWLAVGLIAGGLLVTVPMLTYSFGNSSPGTYNQSWGMAGYGMTGSSMGGMMGASMMGMSGTPMGGMMGPSMMGVSGSPMGGMMGTSTMSGSTSYGVDTPTGVSLDAARAGELIGQYIAVAKLEGISLAEIMEFEGHFYVELKEDSGKYTHELIVDKATRSIYPEMGPNMMWNTKYGHMGGMMSMSPTTANNQPVISAQGSIEIANRYLAGTGTGETAAEPHEFYGYYTLHTIKDGKIYGMLSVNSNSGQVWYHNWHGSYIPARGQVESPALGQEPEQNQEPVPAQNPVQEGLHSH